MNYIHNKKLTPYSQKLRREMTKEERHLWYDFLKEFPYTVNRQKVIGQYIVDFYISQLKLVIELDGSGHYTQEAEEADKKRDEELRGLGLTVLRFTNLEINTKFRAVCDKIEGYISNTSSDG